MKISLPGVVVISLLAGVRCHAPTSSLKHSISRNYSMDVSGMNVSVENSTETAFDCYATLLPLALTEMELSYKVLNQSFPQGWDIAFCDNQGCHLAVPDSCVLAPMTSNHDLQHRQLKLLVQTNGMGGKGSLSLLLYEKGIHTPDTLVFRIQ